MAKRPQILNVGIFFGNAINQIRIKSQEFRAPPLLLLMCKIKDV